MATAKMSTDLKNPYQVKLCIKAAERLIEDKFDLAKFGAKMPAGQNREDRKGPPPSDGSRFVSLYNRYAKSDCKKPKYVPEKTWNEFRELAAKAGKIKLTRVVQNASEDTLEEIDEMLGDL